MSESSTAGHWLRKRAEQAPLVAVWAAGAALTAVGMYSVAVACGIPGHLAWLYPPIFDGLALVAYRTTSRVTAGPGRWYAALVVILCTGLSAAAQAAHLAAGAGLGAAATTHLRAGVGAAPAVAVALAAHLHWLTTRPTKTTKPATSDAPNSGVATGQGQPAGSPAASAPHKLDTTPSPLGVVSTDADQGLLPAPLVGPQPTRSLSVVAPDTSDSRHRTGVSAASSTPVRTVVAAVTDTRPGHPGGQSQDTPGGHPADSRTDPQDTPPSDSVLTPGEDTRRDSGQRWARVSDALTSGLSVRRAAAQLGESKSYVEKVSRDLAAARQNPSAKGRQ